MHSVWGTQLFSKQQSIFSKVCQEWAVSKPAFSGPDEEETAHWEAKIEKDFFGGRYTIWTTATSASAALLVVIDMIKAEASAESVVLYGSFAYVGYSGSHVLHSTSPVTNSENVSQSDGATVIPLPYYLDVRTNQQQLDDAGLVLFRNLCAAWSLRERRVVAVVVEPMISWTGHRLSAYFLKQLQLLATELGVFLVLDEVITAFRLTGSLYCFDVGFQPDVVILGKVFGFGLALLRSDLQNGVACNYRRASTSLPLFHLQFLHKMLQFWTTKFGKETISAIREKVILQLSQQLGLDKRDMYGEGLLICGPFTLKDGDFSNLIGPKNRLLLVADGKMPKNLNDHLMVDREWKKNMKAMEIRLLQMTNKVEDNIFYRAAVFFQSTHTTAPTENELWTVAATQLGTQRRQVKQLFQKLGLVKSSRKANKSRKGRTRCFYFDFV